MSAVLKGGASSSAAKDDLQVPTKAKDATFLSNPTRNNLSWKNEYRSYFLTDLLFFANKFVILLSCSDLLFARNSFDLLS